ncbi:MAG: Fe-S cluster assembly ATPase SufC [Saprospiraceae bacterium]
MELINIDNLHVEIEGKEILKGLNLKVNKGEIHAIMGPNGTGKSTLASALSGKPEYEVTQGTVLMNGVDLLELDPDERALEGLFLSFQYPVEIPGVSMINFMKTIIDTRRKKAELDPIDPAEFLKLVKRSGELVGINDKMRGRAVNEGFSGGEKKKNEIFQMAMIEPQLAILDELDSGLDIDALKHIADALNKLHTKDNSYIIITHYQRLLDYVKPDFVHIMYDGRIVKSGDGSLAAELESKGYDGIMS